MCQVALPAVRDEFMGSGTGQSLQESQSVNDVFYLRCVFVRISLVKLQELEVKKFLPGINLIQDQHTSLA